LACGGAISSSDRVTTEDASSSRADAPSEKDDAASSVAGSSTLTFAPTVVGFATDSGDCNCTRSQYERLVVFMTDDPALPGECTEMFFGPEMLDPSRYHYLLIEVFSSTTTMPPPTPEAGTYPVNPDEYVGQYSYVINMSSGAAFFEPATNGAVQIDQVGSSVRGTFTAADFTSSGVETGENLSGSFDATSCPAVIGVDDQPCEPCSSGSGSAGGQ